MWLLIFWVCVCIHIYTYVHVCLYIHAHVITTFIHISHLSFNPPFFIIQLDRRKRIIKIVHTGNNHLLNRTSSLLPQVTLYLKNLITRMPHRQGTLLQRVRRYLNLLKAVAVEAHRLPLQRRRIHRRMYHLLTTSPPRISSLLLPKVENLLALFPNSSKRRAIARVAAVKVEQQITSPVRVLKKTLPRIRLHPTTRLPLKKSRRFHHQMSRKSQ